MTNTATEASVATVKELQISGVEIFEGHRWREAILRYLNGVWSGDRDIAFRPKIHFSTRNKGLSLHFERKGEKETYLLSGQPINPGRVPIFEEQETVVVGESRAEVEQGLIRFVKDDRIRMFVVHSPTFLCLWKSEKRAKLHISALDIMHE